MEPLIINAALTFAFKAKVEKMNRKAAKLGMPEVDYTFGNSFEQPVGTDTIGSYETEVDGKKRRVALYREVFLHGEAPVIEGYEFVATVDLRGAKPMVKRQPFTAEDANLTPFFENDGHCDHCGFNRQRNDVLILREVATGKLIQIGRSCAADFFRSKNANAMVAVCDWVDAYGNVSENSPRTEPYMTVRRLFETCAAVVRTFGWVHQRDAEFSDLRSTKGRVWQNLFPVPEQRQKFPEDYVTITDEDRAETDTLIEWADRKFFSADAKSDFEYNVQAAVEDWNGTLMIRERNLNFLIWMIAGYKRDLQKEAEERRKRAERAKQVEASDWVGDVGQRSEFDLTVQFTRTFDGQYGARRMVKLADADDNVFVWWGTNDFAFSMEIGSTYKVKATIKKHDEYNECKQTVITRVADAA